MRPALRLVPPPLPPAVETPSPLPVLCRAVMAAVGALLFVAAVTLGFLSDACSLAGRSAYDLAEGGHG